MKVLQVISSYPPAFSYGGALRVAYEISKELVQRGHDVTVYTTDVYDANNRMNSSENPIIMDGITIFRFKNINNKLAYNNFPIAPQMASYLDNDIKKYDIIHLQEYRSYQAILVHYYAKKYRVPYIVQPHASTPRLFKMKRLKLIFDTIYGTKILRDAKRIIAVSEEEANYDAQLVPDKEKIRVVYNGIHFEYYARNGKKKFKDKYGINGKMILYLGRISDLKGIDILIMAFSELLKETTDIVLVIAGAKNSYSSQLERLTKKLNVNNSVIFTGFLDEEDKFAAYAEADVFVHAVKYMGGVGIAPIESIINGTPVIVTRQCGEIIQKAGCGVIVEYGDIESLKDNILYLLNNPNEGCMMVERGRKFLVDNQSWPTVVDNVIEIYRECRS